MEAARGRRDALVALGVAVAVVAIQWPTRLVGLSMMDEGAVLQLAGEILAGKRPYADAVHYAFPGVFYLTAAAFHLGGTSMETARLLTTGLFAATAAVVYGLARWWLSRTAALGVVVLLLVYRVWAYPHWQILNYSSVAIAWGLGALLATGWALGRPGLTGYAWAGAIAAVATLMKQDSGGATTVALGLGLLVLPARGTRSRLARTAAFVAGGSLVALAAAGALGWAGILDDLVRETVLAPLYGVRHYPYASRPALWPLVAQDAALRANLYSYFPPLLLDAYGSQVFVASWFRDTPIVDAVLKVAFHLPWIVLVLAAVRWLWRGRPEGLAEQRWVLLVLVAAACLVAFNRPHDWVHLLVLYPPTLLLVVVAVARLAGRGWRRRIVVALAWAALVAVGVPTAAAWRTLARALSTPVHTARGTVYGLPLQAEPLQALLDAISATTPPAAPVFAFPYHPLVTFLAGRPTLSRFYVVWPVDPESRRDALLIRRLDDTPQAVLVYSPTQTPHFPSFEAYAPELFQYLASHYGVAAVYGGDFGGFSFLTLQRATPPAGRALLGVALAGAQVAIERPGRPPEPLAGAARAARAAAVWWPFVRALRVAPPPDGTLAVSFLVEPTVSTRFRASVGQNPDGYGPAVHLSVAVRDVEGREAVLFTAAPNPLFVPADRRWQEVDVDLAPFAGQRIVLVLRAHGPSAHWPTPAYTGWGTPRLVE